jgi:hypothetical protein
VGGGDSYVDVGHAGQVTPQIDAGRREVVDAAGQLRDEAAGRLPMRGEASTCLDAAGKKGVEIARMVSYGCASPRDGGWAA